MSTMFRGSSTAKIDEKGRLKIPTEFRRPLESLFGREVFLTSLHGACVQVYPLPAWEEIEARLLAAPSTLPAKRNFLSRVNYFGQQANLDAQGRVVVSPILREATGMAGEVVVCGVLQHLEVWNPENFQQMQKEEPLTNDDLRELAELGI